ncbi:DUF885 family protein [Caulobacter sp. S45]|uniref:DUF885 domain-containing protein n=1 Tax=Caulobacter sp. S45 TaxID=1641861 RepID=UPI001575F191|nr:DUF885 family protein [Caulobacter sp. S45]
MNRRDLLAGGAGVAGLALAARTASAQTAAGAPSAQLNAVFDGIMKENLDRSPELATSLGLDMGARAGQKALLDDRSIAAWEGDKRRMAAQLARLKGVDRSTLGPQDRVNLDSLVYVAALNDQANRRFPYSGGPYVVSQLTGAYQGVPDFLDTQHSIETKADADDYLSRLSAFATALDQEDAAVRHDVALGVTPPDFILDKTLIQLRALRDTPPATSNMVQSVARRTHEKGFPGDYAGQATAIYTGKVQPALDRQIALATELRAKAVHDAGVARLPDGPDFYALSLKQWTTSDMPPAEIHQTGLDLVASHQSQLDSLMKSQGLTQGTVGERFRVLYNDPKYRYPNTDEGKVKLIADLNLKVAAVQAKLPAYFGTLPKARLDIRRVPKATEAGAPGGYYQPGDLAGTRPGAYYINLRDTAEVPSWTLPTLTFHEGIPGHHLQGSLAMEASLPLIRKTQWFSGYGEGWALYAENLAVEMGMYDSDPLGHIGQLHDSMFRAVRLVVDTGLHSQGWSREKAIRYYVDSLGDQDASATTEVERYCVWPGQACSYMLGKLDWLRQRERAKTALGPRFDIRKFHDAGLLAGAMPLAVLDTRIGEYIRTA